MTPEQMLALALSTPADLEQEKLAHALDQLSVDELEQIYRSEKTAFAVSREGHKLDARDYNALAKAHAEMAEGRKEYDTEAPIRSHLTGQGAQGTLHRIHGRHFDYAARKHEEGKNAYNPFGGLMTKSRYEKKEKKSSVEDLSFEQKLELADQWGRELAHGDFEKTAALPGFVGKGLVGLMNAGHGARAAVGAGVGALGGAGSYALQSPEQRQKSSLGARMLGGAALGAGAGLGAKPAVQALGGTRTGIGQGIRKSLKSGLQDAAKNAPKGQVSGFENLGAAQAHQEMMRAARGKSSSMGLKKSNPNWRQSAGAVKPEVAEAAKNMPGQQGQQRGQKKQPSPGLPPPVQNPAPGAPWYR